MIIFQVSVCINLVHSIEVLLTSMQIWQQRNKVRFFLRKRICVEGVITVRFNGHFSVEPGLAGFIGAVFVNY